MEKSQSIDGRVTAVRGAVLDIAFDGTKLPPIDDALVIASDKGIQITAEVQSHLDETTVRTIALQSTAGLRRGVVAHPSGGSLEVPVGAAVLGRLFDLTGATGHKGKPFHAWSSGTRAYRYSPESASVREGHEMLLDMRNSVVLERTVLVYGRMNEPPGARWRVPLTALTTSEYFRDERRQSVLLAD